MSSGVSSPSACFSTLGPPRPPRPTQVSRHPAVSKSGSNSNEGKLLETLLAHTQVQGWNGCPLPSSPSDIDSVVKSSWIPCSLPPPWPVSESLQGLFLPPHPVAPDLQSPFIIFKYERLCFTLNTLPILTCSDTPPSPSINLLAESCTRARLIYLLSSTYFMSACLYLFAVSPPSLRLIMHKSPSPLCMAG